MVERYARLLCLGALTLACSGSAGSGASPLALYPASPEGDSALLRGTLERNGACLYITAEGGERWLAAFPSPGTSWDPENQSVQVGDKVLRVGARGGFGGGESKGGPSGLPWLQAPGGECDGSKIWVITTLVEP